MGAEFLAMILVIVYVGAVAVLFLFVVMMLDIDFAELRHGFLNYLPVGVPGRRRAAGRTRVRGRGAGRSTPPCPGRSRRQFPRPPRSATPRRSASCSTPATSTLPGGGPDPAGRDDRRHRADAAHKPRCQRQIIAAQLARPRRCAIEVVKVKSGGRGVP